MAFPAIVGTPTESATTTAGTSHVVNLPAGAAGNLFLLVMGKGTTSATINALTGWTELVDEAAASSGFCAWHLCDGTEGTTTTFTSSASTKSASIVYEISGQSEVAPQISAVASASTNAPNPNTCTPTGGAKDYLWITWFVMGAASEEADDDTWANNAATGYSGLLQKTSGVVGTNIGAAVASCYRTNNAASEDAAWPAGSTDLTIIWRSFTVGVHPKQLASISPATVYTETGVLADLIRDYVFTASTGTFNTTGVDATLEKSAALTAYSMDASPDTFLVTGAVASPVVGRALAGGAAVGPFIETGVLALTLAGRVSPCDTGTFASTGVQASTVVGREMTAEPGIFYEVGADTTLSHNRVLNADATFVSLDGVFTSTEAGRVLAGGALQGVYYETGVDATLETVTVIDIPVDVDPGVFEEIGIAATVVVGRSLPDGASPGSYNSAGVEITTSQTRVLIASPGSLVADGVQASTVTARILAGGAVYGEFQETGSPTTLPLGRALITEVGAFYEAGVEITPSLNISLTASPGTFSATGTPTDIVAGRSLNGGAVYGAFLETGALVTTSQNRAIIADTQTFLISGNATDLSVGRVLSGEVGTFIEAGASAFTVADRLLSGGANTGNFIETGNSVDFIFDRKLLADIGAYTLAGPSVALTRPTNLSGTIDCVSAVVGEVKSYLLSRPSISWGKTGGGGRPSIITNRKRL